MKKRMLVMILILTVWTLSCRTLNPSSVNIDLEAEEYAVYSAVIGQLIGESDQLVLREYSSMDMLGDDTSGIMDYIQENVPQIDEGLIRRFINVNKGEDQIRDHLNLTADIHFIGQDEFEQIFKVGGWEEFYTRYPESNGVITLSRIAFDNDYEHALVYIGHSFDFLGGVGQYVYLSKLDGSWMVEETILAWIS